MWAFFNVSLPPKAQADGWQAGAHTHTHTHTEYLWSLPSFSHSPSGLKMGEAQKSFLCGLPSDSGRSEDQAATGSWVAGAGLLL